MNPTFAPEVMSIILFGPGVNVAVNANRISAGSCSNSMDDSLVVSGCIIVRNHNEKGGQFCVYIALNSGFRTIIHFFWLFCDNNIAIGCCKTTEVRLE